MIGLILLFLFCLLLSAFFSGAEMAFVSANKVKLRELADAGNPAARVIVRLHERPHHFLTGILMGNNIVDIVATAILTYLLGVHFDLRNEWIVTLIMSPLLIIFGEMVPKDYGRIRSQSFLLQFSGLLNLLSKIFTLPAGMALKGIDLLMGSIGSEGPRKSIFVDEAEFRSLIEESTKLGVLADHEKKLIDTILDFERIHVESVMIPMDRVLKVEIKQQVKDVKEMARRTKFRMALVYEEIPSIIVGMIYVYDVLFEDEENQGLKSFLRSPIFLTRNTSIEKAFLMLQHKRQSFAVVTDFNGDVMGVVPIERLLAL